MNVGITELVKNNTVRFQEFRDNIFYYSVTNPNDQNSYLFEVPLSDIQQSDVTASLLAEDKAIMFMRWIRKSIESGTLEPMEN